MSIKLAEVVPWGRSLEEYIRMFDLNSDVLKLVILDCGGGPSSFNAEMTRSGYKVISCDPIYRFSAREIARRIKEVYPVILSAQYRNKEKFVWQDISSPEELGRIRMTAMENFLEDFPAGLRESRYVKDELPTLSFSTNQFDLALCSHLLFTYSDQLSADFHLASILEMCRVAKEVRVFPLVTQFTGEPSPFLQPIVSQLTARGYQVELKRVSYEFQRNGNQVLRVFSNH